MISNRPIAINKFMTKTKISSSIRKAFIRNKLLTVIFLFALVVRVIGLVPNLGTHPDEGIIYSVALKMVTDFTLVPEHFKYGTLYIYFQSVISFIIRSVLIAYSFISTVITTHSIDIFGTLSQYSYKSIMQNNTPYFDFYIFWGRFLTALFGALTIIPTYKIGKVLFNKKVGLIAGIIIAFSGLFTRDSQYITIEVPWAFFTTVAVLFCCYFFLKQDRKNAIFSGFFVGLSTSMKYLPIAFPALVVVIVFSFKRSNLKIWINNSLVSLLMIPIGFVAGSPFLPFNLPQFVKEITWFFNFYGHESWWKEGSGFQLQLVTGQFKIYQIGFIYKYGLGEIASFFAIAGLIFALFKSLKKTLVLLASPAFIISFFVLATSTLYTRQVAPSVPFICIFAAVGILWFWSLFKNLKVFKRYRHMVLIVIVLVAIAPLIIKTLPSSYYCGKEKSIRKARVWLSQDPAPIPLESRVAVSYNISMPSWMKYDVTEMKTEQDYSLSSLKGKKISYVLLYDEALVNFLDWTREYFMPTKHIEGSAITKSVRELKSKGKVIASFTKPIDYELCPDFNVYVIKL